MQIALSRKRRLRGHSTAYVAAFAALALVLVCLILGELGGTVGDPFSGPGAERAQPRVDQVGSPILVELIMPRRSGCQSGLTDGNASDDAGYDLLLDLCESEIQD